MFSTRQENSPPKSAFIFENVRVKWIGLYPFVFIGLLVIDLPGDHSHVMEGLGLPSTRHTITSSFPAVPIKTLGAHMTVAGTVEKRLNLLVYS